MSTLKTLVTPQLMKDFVKKHGYADSTFEPIDGGELSQAYFFRNEGNDKVLRINSTNEGFLKDIYAYEHFKSDNIRIPVIEGIGKLTNDKYFAISERVPGKTLDLMSEAEIATILPEIISTADAIHATAPAGPGYGWWRSDGSGKYSSWLEALSEMQKAEDDDKLDTIAFYENDLRDRLKTEIKSYYKYCPEDRHLLHGDYGFGNALSDSKTITGVIDWHDSQYGDPVWDIAWLDFWGNEFGFAEAFSRHYKEQGRLPTNFDQRLTCYKLIIAANSLAFFAKSEQQEKYNFLKQIMTGIKRP